MTELRSNIIEKMTEKEQMEEFKKHLERIDDQAKGKEEFPICVLCKGHLSNPYGNNPQPVRKRGKCCDKCNYNKVLPARMGGLVDFGSWEEYLLQQKVFAIASYPELLEKYEDEIYCPEIKKVKNDFIKSVMERGMFPIITLTADKRSISYVSVFEAYENKMMY